MSNKYIFFCIFFFKIIKKMEDSWKSDVALQIHDALEEMYRESRHTDVNVTVEDRTFRCHRAVLAAVSPYFDAMFLSGMKESIDGVVNLQGISKENFESIIKFIYTGSKVVTKANAEELLKASALFQIKQLHVKCEQFLLDKINNENCIGAWKLAKTHECPNLSEKAWEIITFNFQDICRSEDFQCLDKDDLIEIITHDDLHVSSEELVCDSVFRWYATDPEGRKQDTIHLFEYLRLPLLGSEYLLHEVEPLDIVNENSRCREIVKEAIQYQLLPSRRWDFNSPRVAFRKYASVEDVLIVIGGYNSVGEKVVDMLAYSFIQAKWFFLTPMPVQLGREFATVVYGNDIFVSGGSQKLDCLLRYRAENNDWYRCTSPVQGRRRHVMVAVCESIFVLGGYDDTIKDENKRTLSSVEEYLINARTWRKAGDIVHAVRSMSAAVSKEKIYVFGGILADDKESDAIQCFDTRLSTSLVVSFLPSPCKLSKTVVCDKHVYIVCTDGSLLEMSEKGDVSCVHTMKYFNRRRFGALHRKGGILLVGGESGNAISQKIVFLNPDKKWTEYTYSTTMPARANFGSLIIILQKKYLTRTFKSD